MKFHLLQCDDNRFFFFFAVWETGCGKK